MNQISTSNNRGDDYIQTKPATLISILDFTLFEDAPEFYSTYRLTNQNNGKIYTDKFTINVLDLIITAYFMGNLCYAYISVPNRYTWSVRYCYLEI